MKMCFWLPFAICAVILTSCETATPHGGASSFRLSAADHARHREREARKAQEAAVAHGAADGGSLMYQQNESGPFGSRSSTGVIQSSGGVQSYQTIGGTPVYPGMPIPGYNYCPQPIYVGGQPTHYWGATTMRRTVTP